MKMHTETIRGFKKKEEQQPTARKKEDVGHTCDELLGIVELEMGSVPCGLRET